MTANDTAAKLGLEDVWAFIKENWEAIVKFFDKLWAFAKDTVLKDDSIFSEAE